MRVEAPVLVAALFCLSVGAGCGSSGRADSTEFGGEAASGNAGGASGNGSGGAGSDGGSGGLGGGFFDGPDAGPGECRTEASCELDECGPIADGCGAIIDCGGCEAPATCGGAGVPSHCGVPGSGGSGGGSCTPTTCEALGVECGLASDGCGGVLDCNAGGLGCADSEQCTQGSCVSSCTPRTCDYYAGQTGLCGLVSDGCSGTIDCGFSCGPNEVCGLGGAGVCGTATCTPLTCEQALADKPNGFCGFVADGCGGEVAGCGTTCVAPETCGGGAATDAGVPVEVCGEAVEPCDPLTCGDYPSDAGLCGPVTDGCGGTLNCGFACDSGDVCGLNQPGVCGTPTCTPRTCQEAAAECGAPDDGCGGTLDCGSTCPVPGDTCAGGGQAFQCGQPSCTPMTCQEALASLPSGYCGFVSDGCGGEVTSCGTTCTLPETCGGGTTPNVCGSSCVPQTCGDIGASCGSHGDGCSGFVDCGSCASGFECQGLSCVATTPCDNYCQNQASCPSGSETRVTGTVYAPNGTEPLPNALVYVPNLADLDTLPAISTGPSCERCEDEDLGDPLVAAISGPDGTFSLDNVPSGVDFPLVVKLGKWRRVVWIPAVADCSDNALAVSDTRMPQHTNDAAADLMQHVNIPHFAMVTGQVDAIECVLRKIGIADSEFSSPAGSGRVHIYRGDKNGDGFGGSNGASYPGSSTRVGTLLSGGTINAYDVAIFDCEGYGTSKTDAWRTALESFANAGGRVFASHYSYEYLEGNTSFDGTATWGGDEFLEAGGFGDPVNNNPTTGIIDTSHSKGQSFDAWLGHVGAHHSTYGQGYISIIDPRGYVSAVDPAVTERFVYLDDAVTVDGDDINDDTSVQQYAFNTPVGAAPDAACGRVVYSAFHVAGDPGAIPNYDGDTFPNHCDTGPLTPQEKVLEYMIFDLSSCVSVSVPPSCSPRSCADAGANCGYLSDGCGGLLNCGTCSGNETCGGGGTPNQCGSSCQILDCGDLGANCGTIADGCGGTLNCGTCTAPAVCGGGGTSNVCGTPACTPRSCGDVGAECGSLADGCGGTVNCGDCTLPETCGGSGSPNVCGEGTCSPQSCGDVGANCGLIGDGCGGTVNCGSCPTGASCGAGGTNVCGAACTPRTCADAVPGGANCGFVGDGCGGVINCGSCSEGLICGGGGEPSRCGGSFCTPTTCQAESAECGAIADTCGGAINCGTCPSGQVCGAVQANQCDPGSCTPRTACDPLECGLVSDGCDGTLDCGTCGCVPLTCGDQGANCGPVADGCGGLLDCGTCAPGQTCGGGGTPSVCGSIQ